MNSKKLHMYLIMVMNALLRRKLRMFIALLAVAIGATIISGMMTVYKEVPEQMGREFRAYGANLLLLPAEGSVTMDESKLPAVYAAIEKHEVVGEAPFLYERLKINESPVLTGGTDFDMLKKVSPYWQVNGALPSKGSDEILLGYEVAQKYKAQPGDKVFISYGEEADEHPFTVAGIVRTGGKEEQFAYVDLPVLQKLVHKEGEVSLVQVSVVASGDAMDALMNQIRSDEPSIQPQAVKQITRSEETVLAKLQALVLIVTLVVLLLTLVCVGTTMTEVVSERRKEIGLKKALGADNRDVVCDFIGESCLLGLFGGVLGAFFGYLFANAVGVNVFGRSIEFAPGIAVMAVAASIVVTAVASILPVRTAVKVDPAIVLRGE